MVSMGPRFERDGDEEVPNRRASDRIPQRRYTDRLPDEFDEFVHKAESRGRRVFLGALISISIIAISTAISLGIFGRILGHNEEVAKIARAKAEAIQIQQTLAKEKVCSQTSDRLTACQALFERLAGALSEEQRVRLACQTARYLNGPTADKLLQENPQCKIKVRGP